MSGGKDAISSASTARGERRERLRRLIEQRSFKRGQFRLASGATAEFFVDMKQTIFHPEGAALTGALLLDALAEASAYPRYVGGLETGAIPVTSAMVLASGAADAAGGPVEGFFVRKVAKGTGTNATIDGIVAQEGEIVVVEDVTTTGGSALKAVEALRAAGYAPKTVATIVDREAGAAERLAEHDLRFVALFRASELGADTTATE